jgi:XRE family transcriptional regulator, regulator of sulfur utilization
MSDVTPAPELDELAQRIGRVVRANRTAQAMSLGDLARACGLSKTILARIESGGGNPSMETLWRVSQGLRLPLGALLAEDQQPRVRAIGADRGDVIRADTGMTARILHAEGREHRSEVFELILPTGVEQPSTGHLPGTEELVVCTRGRVLAGPLGDEVELAPGDAVWFVADGPHRYVGVRDARALNWIIYAAH